MEQPLQVFCCYAHEDRPYLLTLKKHLRPYQREGLIIVQADIDVSPGEEWERKISHFLNAAQIILLLISPDFIDSDYCYSKEMKRAMERHKAGEACVIPIILRSVDWSRAPFSALQALPTHTQPITSWHTEDEAFFNVARGIRDTIEKLMIQLQSRMIALFGYETQGGRGSILWTNPHAFSLNETTYLEWLGTKRDFTKGEIVNHTWVKAGDHGYSHIIHFLSNGHLHENPISGPSRQLQGSWQLMDGILKTTIEQDENGIPVIYKIDIIANKNGLMHSGIESNSEETGHTYFVFLPSQQATTIHHEEALTAFNELLRVNQNCVEAYNARGDLLLDLRRYKEALNAYQRAIELRPSYTWAWHGQGNVLYKMKRYEEANVAFDHAIELDGKNAWDWYEKGQISYDLKRYKEALTLYEQAIAVDPNQPWFWHRRGETFRELQRYKEALLSYEQAVSIDPKFARSYNGMGNVFYRKLQNYGEAIVAYQRATEIDPRYMWAWHNMGNVLHELRRFEEALNAYKRTTEIDSSYFWAWQNMGVVLHELGHLEEALIAFDQAIDRDKRVATAWREKGKTHQALEQYEEALASYEQALELDSQNIAIWIRKGQVLRILKRYEEALTAYDHALQIQSNYVDAYLGKGRVYLDLGSYHDALDVYEQATTVAPNNTWAWHDKGQTLGYLQHGEEALKAFEHAIELDPDNKWAWLHKAETLMYLARQAYKKAGQPGREPLKRQCSNLIQKATNKCLDGNGDSVYMHDPNGGDFQLWKAIEISPDTIVLKHFWSGKVLEATAERGIYYNVYTSSSSQQWKLEDADDGYKKLNHVATGMLLDGDANNGVYLQSDNGGDFQAWRAVKIDITSFTASYDSLNDSETLTFEQ